MREKQRSKASKQTSLPKWNKRKEKVTCCCRFRCLRIMFLLFRRAWKLCFGTREIKLFCLLFTPPAAKRIPIYFIGLFSSRVIQSIWIWTNTSTTWFNAFEIFAQSFTAACYWIFIPLLFHWCVFALSYAYASFSR